MARQRRQKPQDVGAAVNIHGVNGADTGVECIKPEIPCGSFETVTELGAKVVRDAQEYEQKFLATSALLEEANRQIAAKDLKLAAMGEQLEQYVKDLYHFRNVSGQDYASRRIQEVQKRIEEIGKI